jgi:hypothetical protein
MITVRHRKVALYVERSSQQWVVRDPEGNFWSVPPSKPLGSSPTVFSDR